MDTVTISPKYQVVIPRAIREKWNVKPGQKVDSSFTATAWKSVPVRDDKSARGFQKA